MKKFLKIIIVTVLVLICASQAQASTLLVNADKKEITAGGLSTIVVTLDTQSNLINTIEGDLVYDTKLVKVEKISIGNSFVSFWVEKPAVGDEGRIHFSGIIPGGITIAAGEVFSVIFRGNTAGNATMNLENVHLYLNDGEGSEDTTKISNASVTISANPQGTQEALSSSDTTIPEKFKIYRTKSSYVHDNKWFVAFSTQDKGSGIDHYEVCEFSKKNCVISESPHLLKHQMPFYRVIVKAYDADGNVRSVVLLSEWLLLVMIVVFGSILFAVFRLYHRYLRKYRV